MKPFEISVSVQSNLGERLSNFELDHALYKDFFKAQAIPISSVDILDISIGISDASRAEKHWGIFWFSQNAKHHIEIYPENILVPIEVLATRTQYQKERFSRLLSYYMSRVLVHETIHHNVHLMRIDYEAALTEGTVDSRDFFDLKPFGLASWKELSIKADPNQLRRNKCELETQRRDQLLMKTCPWLGNLITCKLK